jgi:hypothetical protein
MTGPEPLLRLPRGRKAEVRVTADQWKGRVRCALRVWWTTPGATAMTPTKRGLTLEADEVRAVADVLRRFADEHGDGKR